MKINLVKIISIVVCSFAFAATFAQSKDKITIFWNESKPFVFKDSNGKLSGIESEILYLYKDYMKKNKGKSIQLNFAELDSFSNVFQTTYKSLDANVLGSSAFSITSERTKKVDFCLPYMSDITVMISHSNIPQLNSSEQDTVLNGLKAITIKSTTYETDLEKLRFEKRLKFKIHYIPSEQNILKHIKNNPGTFGFIDLPVYLMYYKKDPNMPIIRQNLYTQKRTGYAFIFPKDSPLRLDFDEFIKSNYFKTRITKIVGKYFDADIYNFMDSLSVQTIGVESSLLNKEKEIQSYNLLWKNDLITKMKRSNYILISLLFVLLFLAIVVYSLFVRTKNINKKLEEQKIQIIKQQTDIEQQNILLAKRNERLLKINEEKNHLIKVLSHDLRTPLNQISGLSEVILIQNDHLSNEQKDLMNMIKESSERMTLMINKILDTESIDKGQNNIILEKINASQVLNAVCKAIAVIASKKDIKIQLNCNAFDKLIYADFLILHEVFENIITNAIKFSYRGSQIEINCYTNNDKLIIAIRDFGVGMSPEDLSQLFKPFVKLSSKPTENEKSTGLGLSIVYNYVTQMNGNIECNSTKNVGTTFTLRFELVS